MLYFLLLFIVCTQLCEGEENKTAGFCILPPYPKHGSYKVTEPEIVNFSPGDQLKDYTLEFLCDPGYQQTSTAPYVCYTDGSSYGGFGDIAECLPECEREQNNVLSCGAGWEGERVRCIAPSDQVQDVVARFTLPNIDDTKDCGFIPFNSDPFISGGRSAKKQELPWHAGIYSKTKKPYMQICGGSLVSETVVISAAHCFWGQVEKQLPASDYAVAVGKLYRPWNEPHDEQAQKSDVSEIKLPPRFQGSDTNLQDDIALVIVSTPFKYTDAVKPVCLDFDVKADKSAMTAGNSGKVGGWGLTGEDGSASQVLKVVEMPVVDIGRCIADSDPSFKAYITSDKICAGYQNGTAVCKGDSGGGLSFFDSERGYFRYFLRGVVSGAPRSDHLCNTLAWATFTHLLKHEHFIRETIPETPAR